MNKKRPRLKQNLIATRLDDITPEDIQLTVVSEDIREILEFQPWFEYDIGNKIIKRLGRLYEEARLDKEIRPLGLLICGNINSGKTTLITRFRNIMRRRSDVPDNSILYVEIPVRATLKKVFAIILTRLGKPVSSRYLRDFHTQDLVDLIITELENKKIRLLIIDDLQDLLVASFEDKKDIFTGFKKILNACSTRLVLVGTNAAKDLLYLDEWIDERLIIQEIPRLQDGSDFRNILSQIYIAYKEIIPDWDLAQIRPDGTIEFNYSLILLLLELCQGRLGKLVQNIRYSIIEALEHSRNCVIEQDYRDIFNNDVVFTIIDGNLHRITKELDFAIKRVQQYYEETGIPPKQTATRMRDINATIKSGKWIPFNIKSFNDLLILVNHSNDEIEK